jgi:Ketopantoate reductase PanE/ApbA C terminal
MTNTSPQTLLELLEHAPRSQTAIVLPDENVKVSYDSLRQQIHGVADAFASAGIKGGDLGNVAFNPISALTGGTLEELVRHPDVSALVRQIMVEPKALAARLGIELPISIEQRMAGAEKVGAHKTSMPQDLEAGRPLELEAIAGAVAELGENSACR